MQFQIRSFCSLQDTSEAETEQWVPFEAVTRIYNNLERTWTIRTFNKVYACFIEPFKSNLIQ